MEHRPNSGRFVLYFQKIGHDCVYRATSAVSSLQSTLFFAVSLLPLTNAQPLKEGGLDFEPIQTTTPEVEKSVAAVSGWFDINAWNNRGVLIRSGGNTKDCLGNLSYALQTLGELNSAEYNGASGALSLLPTAGALLGSPTKEMWLLYKLMPLAGLLSMFLSLGGHLMPTRASDFDQSFNFGAFTPNKPLQRNERDRGTRGSYENGMDKMTQTPTKFAEEVKKRADDDSGGNSFTRIWIGIFLQLALIGVVLIAMWYCQRGAVITWWCRVWGWMYFWFFLVTVTSVFENLVADPFTKNYTMRVCKAPNNVRISDSAPTVKNDNFRYALDRIEAGVNTHNRITLDRLEPSTSSRTCFYVIVSIEGISVWQSIAQIISKASTVAVFAFGTALFASSTLLSISAALMLLSLVMSAGVMGRVVAMWIASEIVRNNRPILHSVVKDREEAAQYIEEILEMDGLLIELKGHVIMNRCCLFRKHPWFSWSTYIGLLAKPFPIVDIARRESHMTTSKWWYKSVSSRPEDDVEATEIEVVER